MGNFSWLRTRSLIAVSYEASRLTFYRVFIESLRLDETFTIHCRDGAFTMTKAHFYDNFANVAKSDSYRLGGNYKILEFAGDKTVASTNYLCQTPSRCYFAAGIKYKKQSS